MTAYEELRTGFTAAVSHELRTPLARLLSLLETAALPGENVHELVEQARAEVEQIRELIDEVLFLSELESGARVVSLGAVPVRPELDAVADELEERASRRVSRSPSRATPRSSSSSGRACCAWSHRTSPRTRSATPGPGATFTLAVERVADGDRPPRHRRRRRRRRGGADAAVRALLPRRPRPRVARHRAGPRDRQAHRRRRPAARSRPAAGAAPGSRSAACSRPEQFTSSDTESFTSRPHQSSGCVTGHWPSVPETIHRAVDA